MTATALYLCEVCDEPLVYKGGPHRPRWCAKHRDGEEHRAQRRRQHKYAHKAKATGRRVLCTECHAALLAASHNGLCRFCSIELGLEEPV